MAELINLNPAEVRIEEREDEDDRARSISSEKRKFIELFEKVLEVIISTDGIQPEKIDNALDDIVNNWKQGRLAEQWRKIDWNDQIYRYAYVKRYGAFVAGLVLESLHEAVVERPDLISITQKSHLKVVSMGGGPGNDIVGLCSALKEIFNFSGESLDITIGDSESGWEFIVQKLCHILERGDEDWGSCSEVFRLNHGRLLYDPVTFPDSLTPEFYDRLEQADLILMVRLMSIMDLTSARETTKRLHSAMKVGAVCFYADTAYGTMDIFSEWFYRFETLYELPRKSYSFAGVSANMTIGLFRKV